MIFRVLIVLFFLLNLSISNAVQAAPLTSVPLGKILFVSDKGSNVGEYHIFSMNADGTKKVQLTSGKDIDTRPRWSPDKKKIAFVRINDSEKIWIMDANGHNQKLLFDGSYLSFSPDGKKMVYADASIYIYDFATQKTVKKVDGNIYDGYNAEPDWSPNGKTIVYRNTFVYSFPHVANLRMFSVNSTNTASTTTTTPPYTSLTFYDEYNEGYASQPRWSPNGKEIVYLNDGYLNVMTATGKNNKTLATSPSVSSGGELRAPVWSPDGSYFLATNQNIDPITENYSDVKIFQSKKNGNSSSWLWLTGKTYNSYPADWKIFK